MAASDDSDIPETGAVFTFGKSRFAENLPNKFWVKNDRVLQVACGDEHTALVAESGRVFMFGPNDYGQLGIGPPKIANRPTCIKSLKHEKSKLVACGRSHTIIATESGNIYTFGANGEGQLGVEGVADSNMPKHLDTLPVTPWKMLAAGCDHSMALTDDGRVFVWGGSSEGQLGLGEDESEVPVPKELDVGQPVTCIACGYYHSALVTENGDLYTFGESEGGKLGLGDDTDECKTPQHVMAISDKVKSVSCGGAHTVAVTEKGEVYAFGGGPNGQLGLGVSVLESESPSLLKLPFKVSQVACGENFTAVISEKGQLYTFGDGRHGKLALGQESFSNQFSRCRVDRFHKFNVNQVACGGCHMIVTASPKMENGEAESEEEEDETIMMNGTVRDSSNLNLSRTFSARDRRRHASPLPLHRTLPPLGNNRALPSLNATVPAIKMGEQKVSKSEAAPRLQRSKKIDKMSEEEDSEKEDKEEAKESKPKVSPRKMPPMPSQENGDRHQSDDDNDKDDKSQKEEEEGEEDSSDQEKDNKSGEAEDRKDEEEEEEDDSHNQLKRGPIPAPRKTDDKDEEKDEDEESGKEEEDEDDKDKEEEKEKEEEEETNTKKKDKKDKKKKEEKKKDKKKDKKKKGKKDEEEEEEEEEEGEEEEKDEKSKKGKDKKKDKEDEKKEKEKKKKGKKGKEKDEEEDGEEEEDKDKSKKKKDKKKKGDKDKDDKDKKDENENEEEKGDGDKSQEPKPKKKSRLCTIL
ncbi:X-linked retinitis pigmentosa GTPase regulator-like isoform X2 [Babylonia areolata]|uniref:X-linked retinitis pigmentosa GTPase regulator-like isoform X2 n=1 Tax=Babylonia areolata TaxID=304850 RepID=UPI003FD42E94